VAALRGDGSDAALAPAQQQQQQQQLQQPPVAAGAAAAAAPPRANAAAAALLVHIIREVAALAGELQAGLSHSLSARAPLPAVLKSVALLRRLARLQKKAVERSLASSADAAAAAAAPPPADDAAGEEALAAWLRWLLIAERDATLARELDAAAGDAHTTLAASASSSSAASAAAGDAANRAHSTSAAAAAAAARAQPALLRVLELHRLLSTELISQYAAVSASLVSRSGAGTAAAPAAAAAAAAAADAAARPLLVEAVSWRAGAMLAQACEALTRLPEALMANAQQPMAYAARRSARLGVDYAAPLGVAWSAAVLDAVGSRLLLARRVLAGADAKDERSSLALLNAALRASLDVFNALRNALPRALQAPLVGELLAHFHALADSPVVAEWPSCAGAFSEATQPLLDALAKFVPAQ
jgi:hypothetical protein